MAGCERNSDLQMIGERILMLAADHDVPLTPRIYEVLFAYLTRDDPAFRDSVANSLAARPERREDALSEAYMTYLGNAALEEGLERVRTHLARELSEVSRKLSQGMRGNAQLIKTLQGSLRDLAGTVTREGVQSVARELSTTSKSHLSETATLSDRLNRTQFQLTHMQRELDELRETASTDHLTRLPNRRMLDERLSQMISSGQEFSLALFDIDHFKKVNDTWGHAVGDTVLQGLGQFFKDNLKGRDFAARSGGEEFVVILPATPLNGAAAVCEAICSGFAAIHWVNQQTQEEIGTVGLSGGVTERKAEDSVDSLMHRVDGLLYKAKAEGRGRVAIG